jgi:cbb3-type cytochrome oxidase maturation protein
MNILILMIPMALAFGIGFLVLFLSAVENGQFEDTETPALRILDGEDQQRNRE